MEPTVNPMSYEGLDDEEEVKAFSAHNENNNNNYNVVSNLESTDELKKLFWRSDQGWGWNDPPHHPQSKSGEVDKNLQAWYNENANKIVE